MRLNFRSVIQSKRRKNGSTSNGIPLRAAPARESPLCFEHGPQVHARALQSQRQRDRKCLGAAQSRGAADRDHFEMIGMS